MNEALVVKPAQEIKVGDFIKPVEGFATMGFSEVMLTTLKENGFIEFYLFSENDINFFMKFQSEDLLYRA